MRESQDSTAVSFAIGAERHVQTAPLWRAARRVGAQRSVWAAAAPQVYRGAVWFNYRAASQQLGGRWGGSTRRWQHPHQPGGILRYFRSAGVGVQLPRSCLEPDGKQ